MLDALSDILTRLSVKGTLYFRTSFSSTWGLEVPPFENAARFHFAHRGTCKVMINKTGENLVLAQGDLVIIPHGASHSLFAKIPRPTKFCHWIAFWKSPVIRATAFWFMVAVIWKRKLN